MLETDSEALASLRVLTIHSFAIHGTASIKAVISILGSRVLPVPSLILSGLTNIPNIVKIPVDFPHLWMNSLQLVRQRKQKIILYIGYLGHPGQVEWILKGIKENRDLIHSIVVDPVSGDHGRIYVPESVVNVWPILLEEANWALPNFTELKLYSGLSIEDDIEVEAYISAFMLKYPKINLLITSIYDKDTIDSILVHRGKSKRFTKNRIPQDFGGTGDTFAAHFIRALFYEGLKAEEAVKRASIHTSQYMKDSINYQSDELMILPL